MSYEEVRFAALEELHELVARVDRGQVDGMAELLSSAPRIYVAGAGRSGLAMRGFAMRLMHLGKEAFVVGESTSPALRADELLVVGSGSGSTEGLVAICGRAKRLGARVALITASANSPMRVLADHVVDLPAAVPVRLAGESEAAREQPQPSTPRRAAPLPAEAPGPRSAAPLPVISRQPLASLFEQGLWLLLDSIVMVVAERLGVTGEEMLARHANLE